MVQQICDLWVNGSCVEERCVPGQIWDHAGNIEECVGKKSVYNCLGNRYGYIHIHTHTYIYFLKDI